MEESDPSDDAHIIPIGHTGIRYRVGSYHGHPVQQQFLGTLDSGSLIITDERMAFIGTTKASVLPKAMTGPVD